MHPLFNAFAKAKFLVFPARFALVGFSLQFATAPQPAAWAQTSPVLQSATPPINSVFLPRPDTSMLLPSLPLPTESRRQQYVIRVRNLKASEMAWLLDPAHNPDPLTYQASLRNNALPFAPPQERSTQFMPALILPPGVQQVIAVDPQNILLIDGPEESKAAMTQLVEQRDKPLRQVQIEAQIVRMSPRLIETWEKGEKPFTAPLKLQSFEALSGISVYSGANFRADLDTLVHQRQATVLTAPRVTALNGLTAAIGTQPWPLESAGVKGEPGLTAATGFYFMATPNINEDKTMSLTATLAKTLQLSKDDSTGIFPLQALDVLTTKLAFRDGATLMLASSQGRFASLISGLKFKGSIDTEKQSEVVVLLHVSLIRRFGDDEVVPGT